MKIIKRNSDNIVIYAGDTLTLDTKASNGEWQDLNANTTTHTLLEGGTLPADFMGGQYTHIAGVWAYTTAGQAAADAVLATLKTAKNLQINLWRAVANQTYFTHLGKQVACDELSRSDIDAVAGSISLSGVFPAGFPGAWKAMDNSYIMLPDVAAFKAMYTSMTTQGTVNFGKSQTLKTQLAAATTAAQVNALVWVTPSRACRRRPLPTSRKASICSTRPAPPDGQKASSGP